MDQNKIGKLIAECRKEKNITQKELAEKLNVSSKSVSKWECGTCLPDVSLYKDICGILGITLNEFFAGERIAEQEFKNVADDNLLVLIKKGLRYKKIFIIILTCLVIFSSSLIYISHKEEPYIGSSYAIFEGEDGWYYKLTMNYSKENKAEHIISKYNLKYAEKCESSKVQKVNESTININSCIPSYVNEEEKEALNIDKFFNRKQFNHEITEKDLKNLKTESYDKKIIVELYNKIVKEKRIEDRILLTLDTASYEFRNDTLNDDYKVNVGIVSCRTGILVFRIDLEYSNGTYLSDLITTGTATKEQEETYNNLELISKEFIKTQDRNIREKFNLKEHVYDRVFNIIESINEYKY